MSRRHLYYIEAVVEVPVTIAVVGETEKQALERAQGGAWHNVIRNDWDKAKVLSIGKSVIGPGVGK
jgi:hypothetical protein